MAERKFSGSNRYALAHHWETLATFDYCQSKKQKILAEP